VKHSITSRRIIFQAALAFAAASLFPAANALRAQTSSPMQWTTSIQSGLADTFQLTLGGTFGNGPAWQNRLSSGLTGVLRPGDSLLAYAWDTYDLRNRSNNWQAGLGYRAPVFRKGRNSLILGSGVQRWLFPSVKTGAKDWLIPGNLIYQMKLGEFSWITTADSWSLLKSTLPLGSLVHTQSWLQYRILKREPVEISFRHGPAHTYSWNFYGTQGNRVFRYQSMAVFTFKAFSLEGGYRKQWGLQKGIADNNYWQFAVTRSLSRKVR
jgi:hypothetical protein